MKSKTNKSADLTLSGDCTIYEAAEIKDRLRSALQKGDAVSVDLAAVERTDATFLQLLIAARKQADAQGVILTLVKPSQTVLSMLTMLRCDYLLVAPADRPAETDATQAYHAHRVS